MQKSADAFRTISEVAADLDVPQHVLRFWESKFPQVKPLKRAGGRRYYRPGDIDLLRGIRVLLYGDGYTIKGVQKVLKERGPRFVTEAGSSRRASEPPARANSGEPAAEAKVPARRKRAIDPRELPLPMAIPEMPNPNAAPPPAAMAKPSEPTRMAPLHRRGLEHILSELVEIKRLLKGG